MGSCACAERRRVPPAAGRSRVDPFDLRVPSRLISRRSQNTEYTRPTPLFTGRQPHTRVRGRDELEDVLQRERDGVEHAFDRRLARLVALLVAEWAGLAQPAEQRVVDPRVEHRRRLLRRQLRRRLRRHHLREGIDRLRRRRRHVFEDKMEAAALGEDRRFDRDVLQPRHIELEAMIRLGRLRVRARRLELKACIGLVLGCA